MCFAISAISRLLEARMELDRFCRSPVRHPVPSVSAIWNGPLAAVPTQSQLGCILPDAFAGYLNACLIPLAAGISPFAANSRSLLGLH